MEPGIFEAELQTFSFFLLVFACRILELTMQRGKAFKYFRMPGGKNVSIPRQPK